jgi:hypothetical protein
MRFQKAKKPATIQKAFDVSARVISRAVVCE